MTIIIPNKKTNSAKNAIAPKISPVIPPNDFLDFKDESPNGWGYCVFGIVVNGLDIVDEIANVETGNYGPYSDVPKDVIQIISVKISE